MLPYNHPILLIKNVKSIRGGQNNLFLNNSYKYDTDILLKEGSQYFSSSLEMFTACLNILCTSACSFEKYQILSMARL
jgi:hypothetical protein